MITKRTLVNVAVFIALAVLLVFLGWTKLVQQPATGYSISFDFADGAGIAPRDDVTLQGVPIGNVSTVGLTKQGTVRVVVEFERKVPVPRGTKAEITRRSPIGDITLNLIAGKGPPLPNGAHLSTANTIAPPDPERTIEILTQVLAAVPPKDLNTTVTELARALRGRGRDLASLSETTADLPERILKVQTELRSLITNGPKVTGVLANNADTLADDVTQTMLLADLLRDKRYDLVALSKNGANFAQVANDILATEKPNLACLISDFGFVNARLTDAQDLSNLKASLDLNHFFFDGVQQLVVPGKDGLDWFRVQLLPPGTNPTGRAYEPHRPPPGVYPGNACRSIYGNGVGPVTQPGPVWLAAGSELHPGK